MKAQFLKIAGVKSEKAFYKKYPTEEAFFKAHPEAKKSIKKAQIGAYIGGETAVNPKMINFQDYYDEVDKAITGSTEAERRKAAAEAASTQSSGSSGGIDLSSLAGMFGGGGGEAEYGTYIPKAQFGVDANANGIPDSLEINPPTQAYGPQNQWNFNAQTFPSIQQPTGTQFNNIPSALPKAPALNMPQLSTPTTGMGVGAFDRNTLPPSPGKPEKSPFDFAKAVPVVGGVISAFEAFEAEKKARKQAEQAMRLSEVTLQASRTRPEEIKRRYVTPWDVTVQPNQMFPTYGVGTNVLTAQDGAEIQNTYAPGTLYDNLGYEPLSDSDQVKQYAGGGDLRKAQWGIASAGGAGFGENPYGNIAGGFFDNNAGSQMGGAVGSVFGPVGGAAGSIIGGALDQAFGDAGKIKKYREKAQRNMMNTAMNAAAPGLRAPYTSFMEEGGWVSNNWNPQVITKFGDHTAQDVYDFAHEGMESLRSGGHLKDNQYTPVSNRGLQTYAMGGELKTHWGGDAETMSYNPYLPDGGETVMFRGQSHDESDGKGNTGIGITFGNSPVEVERGEPAVKLKDGTSGEENLTVYGNLQIPNEYIPMLGDNRAKGKKFKNYIAEISKDEAKQNKVVEKSVNQLQELDVRSPFDKLKFDALSANINGANMKLKSIADKKMNAAALQNAINDVAEEHGLVADDLAKGKVKFDKEALQEYAEYGKTIKKAATGTTITDGGKKITKAERDRLLKSGEYKVDPSNPNKIYRVKSKSATSEEKKSASALGYIPKGQSVDPTTGLSTKITPEQFEAFKQENQWYDWSKFDPKDPNAVNDAAEKFNAKAKELGSDARILPDKNGKVTIIGQQFISGKLEDAKKQTPASSESDYLEVEDEDKRYKTTPYKRSVLMDVANMVLPFLRPTDQEPLDPNQLMGEMYALSTNQLEPVQAQTFTPELATPYDISLQDQLNANQADFNAIQRMTGYNPAAQSALAAQKYAANEKVLGEQFRMNQALKAGVYDQNRQVLNQARLQNLNIFDTQYQRQAQAKSNTKAVTQAALNSIADKYAKNRLENRELGVYENLYNYRYDPSGRLINMNPLFQPNMPTLYPQQKNPNMIPVKDAEGNIIEYRSIYPSEDSTATPPYVQIGSRTTDTTTTQVPTTSNKFGGAIKKYAKNGNIVKAYKNI